MPSGVHISAHASEFGLGTPVLLHAACNDVNAADVRDKVGRQSNVSLVDPEYAACLVIREQERKERPILLLDKIRDSILEEDALYSVERILIIYLAEIAFIADHATIKLDLGHLAGRSHAG